MGVVRRWWSTVLSDLLRGTPPLFFDNRPNRLGCVLVDTGPNIGGGSERAFCGELSILGQAEHSHTQSLTEASQAKRGRGGERRIPLRG